jgi:predicted transcriptional regulator
MILSTEILLDKSEVIASFKDLPDKVSAADMIERIIFLQKIEDGLQAIERGEVVSHEEVMKKIDLWRKRK